MTDFSDDLENATRKLQARIEELEVELQEAKAKKRAIDDLLMSDIGSVAAKNPRRRVRGGGQRGRGGMTTAHFEHLEDAGRVFHRLEDFLDSVSEPHYFSPKWAHSHDDPLTGTLCQNVDSETKRHGHGDQAQRQIIVWARKNPAAAGQVTLVQASGAQESLSNFMARMGWG